MRFQRNAGYKLPNKEYLDTLRAIFIATYDDNFAMDYKDYVLTLKAPTQRQAKEMMDTVQTIPLPN